MDPTGEKPAFKERRSKSVRSHYLDLGRKAAAFVLPIVILNTTGALLLPTVLMCITAEPFIVSKTAPEVRLIILTPI